MENVTPLQQKARQLREDLEKIKVQQEQQQQEKLDVENSALIRKFSESFPSLYNLLLGSQVRVEAEAKAVKKPKGK